MSVCVGGRELLTVNIHAGHRPVSVCVGGRELLTVNIQAGHRPVSVCGRGRVTYGEHIGWT